MPNYNNTNISRLIDNNKKRPFVLEPEKSSRPYLSIWIHPKETIRALIAKNKNTGFFYLCFLAGLVFLFGSMQLIMFGFYIHFAWTLIISILLATIIGYATFSLSAFFVYIIGKCMKGKGKYKEIRLAIGWSNFPLIVSLLIWILLLALYQQNIFIDFPGPLVLSENEVIFLFVLMVIQLVVYIWIIILLIQTVAEVQGFPAIKSILNLVIASLAFLFVSIALFIGSLWIWTLLII